MAYTQLSLTATPGRRYSFSAKHAAAGWTNAVLTGIDLETGEPYHIIGWTIGPALKGYDTISGRNINYAIKIDAHMVVVD